MEQIHTQWVHSCYSHDKEVSAVVVKEKQVIKTESGVQYKNQLKVYDNPKRKFWVTNPKFRTYEFKREYSHINELDMYEVEHSNLPTELHNILNDVPDWQRRRPSNGFKKYYKLNDLCNSPYVYGADIDIEVLIKMAYVKRYVKGVNPKFTTGMLDIEACVFGSERINAITFIHENKIYCTMLDAYMFKWKDGVKLKANEKDIEEVIDLYIKPYIEKYNLEIEFTIFPDEIKMIKWIWDKIHFHETDFIGIWNIGYDIPKIISRIEANGYDPKDIMCHPSIGKKYRYLKFNKDNGAKDHFTDKWDWFNCTSHSQFYDAMCLYARLRKVNGRKSSYALDNIANDEIGDRKLKVGEISTHHYMQKYKFCEYVAYNIIDSLLLQLMEWQNNDVQTMTGLVGSSKLSDFSKQTVMLKNRFYEYCQERNLVPASSGSNMVTEFDKYLGRFGGTVLPSERTRDVGLKVLYELDTESLFHLFVSDLDVSSMYPTVTSSLNISKETKIATAISIENRPVESMEYLFGGITSPKENAEAIMSEFFALPNYEEMGKLYTQLVFSKEN